MKQNKCSPINKNILYYDFEHRMCIFRMINKVPAMMKRKISLTEIVFGILFFFIIPNAVKGMQDKKEQKQMKES